MCRREGPTAATAVAANDVAEAYPLLRAGLTDDPHPAFAKAMIKLNPTQASEDLLGLLATTPWDPRRR